MEGTLLRQQCKTGQDRPPPIACVRDRYDRRVLAMRILWQGNTLAGSFVSCSPVHAVLEENISNLFSSSTGCTGAQLYVLEA